MSLFAIRSSTIANLVCYTILCLFSVHLLLADQQSLTRKSTADVCTVDGFFRGDKSTIDDATTSGDDKWSADMQNSASEQDPAEMDNSNIVSSIMSSVMLAVVLLGRSIRTYFLYTRAESDDGSSSSSDSED